MLLFKKTDRVIDSARLVKRYILVLCVPRHRKEQIHTVYALEPLSGEQKFYQYYFPLRYLIGNTDTLQSENHTRPITLPFVLHEGGALRHCMSEILY